MGHGGFEEAKRRHFFPQEGYKRAQQHQLRKKRERKSQRETWLRKTTISYDGRAMKSPPTSRALSGVGSAQKVWDEGLGGKTTQ